MGARVGGGPGLGELAEGVVGVAGRFDGGAAAVALGVDSFGEVADRVVGVGVVVDLRGGGLGGQVHAGGLVGVDGSRVIGQPAGLGVDPEADLGGSP